MGMIGHCGAGPIWACMKVDDCCDPFFVGTLTCIKMIKTIVESILPLNAYDSQ